MNFDSAIFKKIARDALKGSWFKSIITTMIASLCGAFCSIAFFLTCFVVVAVAFINIFNNVSLMAYFDLCVIAIVIAWLYFFIGGMIRFGYVEYSMALLDRRRTRVIMLFGKGSCAWNAIGMKIGVICCTFLWTLLLIFPGIIAHYAYAMVPYILSEREDYTVLKAMRMSRKIMRGHKWRLFCLRFSFLGWKILNILTLGLSSIFVKPYQFVAEAAMYNEISGRAKVFYNRSLAEEAAL